MASSMQAVWVYGSPSFPNPVTDANARLTLVTNAAASHVDTLYVSVYSSTPNGAGRYMYDDSAISDLIGKAHTAGMKVYAAYGAPDWPTFGCGGFPLDRMEEVAAYNVDYPLAKFDGVILDVEPPEPQDAAAYQALLGLYDCVRNALPADVQLSVAIRFFWDDPVQYPANTGSIEPVYAHIIDMNLDHVVVMGYRDYAGPADCSTDGIVCLDQDEIAYAASIGKFDIVLAGLETSDPATTGISDEETFFEEGMVAMNTQAQAVLDHFGVLSGLGGFAIHNYENSYLEGNLGLWPTSDPAFPTTPRELTVSAVTALPNGHIHLQGQGVANRIYNVELSTVPNSGGFGSVGTTTASVTGAIDCEIAPSAGVKREFYRLTYP